MDLKSRCSFGAASAYITTKKVFQRCPAQRDQLVRSSNRHKTHGHRGISRSVRDTRARSRVSLRFTVLRFGSSPALATSPGTLDVFMRK